MTNTETTPGSSITRRKAQLLLGIFIVESTAVLKSEICSFSEFKGSTDKVYIFIKFYPGTGILIVTGLPP